MLVLDSSKINFNPTLQTFLPQIIKNLLNFKLKYKKSNHSNSCFLDLCELDMNYFKSN